jgi:DNA repair protein RadC
MLDEIVALPVALHEINADDLDRVVAEDAARAGGDPTPSDADIKVTRDLIRAGQLLKIDVVDHVIIGRATAARAKDYASLRELGYFF